MFVSSPVIYVLNDFPVKTNKLSNEQLEFVMFCLLPIGTPLPVPPSLQHLSTTLCSSAAGKKKKDEFCKPVLF